MLIMIIIMIHVTIIIETRVCDTIFGLITMDLNLAGTMPIHEQICTCK